MGVVDPSWARWLRDMTLGPGVNQLIRGGLYAPLETGFQIAVKQVAA